MSTDKNTVEHTPGSGMESGVLWWVEEMEKVKRKKTILTK